METEMPPLDAAIDGLVGAFTTAKFLKDAEITDLKAKLSQKEGELAALQALQTRDSGARIPLGDARTAALAARDARDARLANAWKGAGH
jgi:hypothetical protein